MKRFDSRLLLVACLIGAIAGVGQASAAERTLKPAYFLRGLCGAVHAISFDSEGNMWAGCIGDTKDDLEKPGAKKIFRITPDGKATAVAEVNCTAITAIQMGKDELLYVGTEGASQVLSISKDGKQRQISPHGTYRLRLGDDGAMYFAEYDQTWRIAPGGQPIPVLPSGGLWDTPRNTVYQAPYGADAITRRDVKADNSLGPETRIATLPFVKGLTLDAEGRLWGFGYDNGDYMVRFEHDKQVERIRLETLPTVSPDYPQHFLNTMIFGEGAFGKDTIYFSTWAGDIVRVRP